MSNLTLIIICFFSIIINVGLVGINLKIYTEMVKEHTIRRRYESQSKKES